MSASRNGTYHRAPMAFFATALLASAGALVPLAPAGATKHPAKIVVATGSITCSSVLGSVTYHPAEHHVGTVPVRIAIVFRTSHCITTGSNVKRVTGGSLSEVVVKPTNACASGIYSHTVHATGTWTAPRMKLRSSTGTFSGFDFAFAANGDVGVAIPNVGGTAHITGSFAGHNHGATSSAVAYINLTAQQVRAACLSSRGLTSLKITGGRATFS